MFGAFIVVFIAVALAFADFQNWMGLVVAPGRVVSHFTS